MESQSFTDRLSSLKSKLPSSKKYQMYQKIAFEGVISFFSILFDLVRALIHSISLLIELGLNIFIVLCAVDIFQHGIILYNIKNGGNVNRVLIEIGAYFAFMIPAIIVRNIITRYF